MSSPFFLSLGLVFGPHLILLFVVALAPVSIGFHALNLDQALALEVVKE